MPENTDHRQSPPARAFLQQPLLYRSPRIPGITSRQRYFFSRLNAAGNSSADKRYYKELSDYLEQIDKILSRDKIVPADLTLSSQAALTNLRGLLELHRHEQSVYCTLFKVLQVEQAGHTRYREHLPVLQFTPAQRLAHSIKKSKSTITVKISYSAIHFSSEYFQLLFRDLLVRVSGKKLDRPDRDRLLELEKEGVALQPDRPSSPSHTRGRCYDLQEIFDQLNEFYFCNRLTYPHLSWSRQISRHRLGNYDHHRQRMVISRILDHPEIPPFVVRGIVYHEMLHMIHPIQKKNGRRLIHSEFFKKDEQKFQDHFKFERWLREEYPRYLRTNKGWKALFHLF